MRQSDLTSVVAKLEAAEQGFEATFNSVEKQWDDVARRDFEEKYLSEIDPNVQKLIDAVARLATVLTNAEHQCSSEYQS
jgi:hypothetical protein